MNGTHIHNINPMADYAALMRLDKRIGIYLVLWPTLWALWLASKGQPDAAILLVFIGGVVLMRSAGCVINDLADRDIDGHVERTRDRPMAAGRVSVVEALVLFGLLSIASFALVMMLNRLTILISVVGIALAASYPYMKRHHYFPQVHLGVAFAWSIPMAYTAVTGKMPDATGWLLFIATILWTTAYDTMYAMSDREDDVKIGVKSTAILFGDADKIIIAIFQLMFLLCMFLIGRAESLGTAYFVGIGVACVLALYQQFLLRLRDRDDCLRAFMNNNLLGFVLFLGLVWPIVDDLLNRIAPAVRQLLT